MVPEATLIDPQSLPTQSLLPQSMDAALDQVSGDAIPETGIVFRMGHIMLRGTIEECYAPLGKLASNIPLLRDCAPLTEGQLYAVIRKLKSKFPKDFNERTFRQQVKEARAEVEAKKPEHGLIISANGTPKPLLSNAILKLSQALKLGYDAFSSRTTILERTPWGTDGAWQDRDDLEATSYLQHVGVECSTNTGHEAALALAGRNQFHPPRDWMNSLEWDGIPRIWRLMPDYFKTTDTIYNHQIGRMWMISAVARIMNPGCQAKYMIVLEGAQDDGKSKGIRALTNGHLEGMGGRQWYRDGLPKLSDKDIGMYMQGVWVIEVAELAGFQKSDIEEIKAFLSRQMEVFRQPYGRNMKEYSRQCVFAGTVNVLKNTTPEWGKDPTGLVRFWPTRAGKPDIDAILKDYDRLWAEAVHLYKNGEAWHGDECFSQLARAEQEQRMPLDTLPEQISEILERLVMKGQHATTVSEVCTELHLTQGDRSRLQSRIGQVIGSLGWVQYVMPRNGGPARNGYREPGYEEG